MILLVNTFITKQSSTGGAWEAAGIKQDRGNLDSDNKLDVLKYALAGLAPIYPWKRAIIKIVLDDSYKTTNAEQELEEFVRKEFEGIELHYSNKRNVTQQDWIDTYELLKDDNLINCYCSHDHIFLDHSPEYLKEIISDIEQNYSDDYVTLSTSHWSEFIRNAKAGPTNTHKDNPPQFYNINYKLEDNYVSYQGHCYDSIHIISKKLYEDFFLKTKWDDALFLFPNRFASGHLELPRIDGVGITDLNFIRNKVLNVPTPKQRIIIPYRELSRHYDGYFYHGITNEQVPSINIPPGFFESDIKIRYGYDDRKEGWVNINPKSEHYYAADTSGADYKITLKEIPLSWKNRISQFDINPDIDEEEMIQYRLKTVLEMVYTSPNHNPFIDEELETKILNQYMKIFPEYSIA